MNFEYDEENHKSIKSINIEPLYYKKLFNYPQVLMKRFDKRIVKNEEKFIIPFALSIIYVVAFILYPIILSDTVNWDLIPWVITSYILVIILVIFSITIFPDTMKIVKKDLLKLNHIVVNEDLTVSRAYNFIDIEHSSYSNLMIRLPEGTKFLDDYIETEIVKHGLQKEDADLIEQDLKQNCNLEEYNYLELKKIIDAKFSILEYESEKKYLLNKLAQNKRVDTFRRNVFDKNKEQNNNEPSLITELKNDKKRIENDELQDLENLNKLIHENENIVSKYVDEY